MRGDKAASAWVTYVKPFVGSADGSVFVCLEKVIVPVVFGAMGTFGEHYPCTLTCLVAGRLHQDVILGMDWLQREDPLISWRDFTVTFSR